MSLYFKPFTTQDGSIGLYNDTVKDVYHSFRGARTEAFEKFIYPSEIEDKIKSNNSIRVLDICYGMGYNTKAFIHTCLENNFEGDAFIDALEIDSDVVAFSFLTKDEYFDFNLLEFVNAATLNNPKIQSSVFKLIREDRLSEFWAQDRVGFFNTNENKGYKDVSGDKTNRNLHNIYYRNIPTRNIERLQNAKKHPEIELLVHLGDARQAILEIQGNYDCIFLDAFTPMKAPALWSVEFFRVLKDLLKDDGSITTYSKSAAIRNGMREAGLHVGKTQYGTIAYKDSSLIKTPLDEKSSGLLNTKAGIPFYDENLNSTAEEILALREKMVGESKKQNSSQFLKNYSDLKAESSLHTPS